MKKMGAALFWTGFILTIAIIIGYIIVMLINVTTYTSWIASLFVCGVVMSGAVLMLIGRAVERKSGDEI